MLTNLTREADFSAYDVYRYSLRRSWSMPTAEAAQRKATWIMLNPSRADATRDDPTTTQCMNRMYRLGYGRYEAVNLFALVSPYPAALWEHNDPVGKLNDVYILRAVSDADIVVVAWGTAGGLMNRDDTVLLKLGAHGTHVLHCLGLNNDGSPRFPRGITRETELVRYQGG